MSFVGTRPEAVKYVEKFLVGFEVIICRKYFCTDQFFLKDGNKV